MLNMKRHIGSKQEFTNWLTSLYFFYLINRVVDFEAGIQLLPEIHARLSPWRERDEDVIAERAWAAPRPQGVLSAT
jgi:hypothetical protein